MFQKCRHVRSIKQLANKCDLKEYTLLSGNIEKSFYCKTCGKLNASVVIAIR